MELVKDVLDKDPLLTALERGGGQFEIVATSYVRSSDEDKPRGVGLTLKSTTRATAENVTVPSFGQAGAHESFQASLFDIRKLGVIVSLSEERVVDALPDNDDGVGRILYLTPPPSTDARG